MTTHQILSGIAAQLLLLVLVYRRGHRNGRRALQTTEGRRRYPRPDAIARLVTEPQPVTVTELPTVPQQLTRQPRTATAALRIVR